MKNIIYIIAFLLFLASCDETTHLIDIKKGDIVFIGNSNSTLSSAIDEVTKTKDNTSFSHMGIVDKVNDEIFIIHSNSYSGVCIEPLSLFREKNGQPTDSLYFYRFDENLNISYNDILNKAHKTVGEPYNSTYIIQDSGYYCSEFIYYVFDAYDLFSLNPMTFKNPSTLEFNDAWVEYYKKLGIEIPEGLPGCNPNGMAAQSQLNFILKM